jgi:hypothetical protein
MDIINILIEKCGYKTYLEIGVANSDCYRLINCEQKTAVDPESLSKATFELTSDEFFKTNKELYHHKYDIIFIDGLHHSGQVYKDILNALKVLNKGGTIVCHDMNPQGFQQQYVPRQVMCWNGDCWKAWVKLRTERKDLEMFVLQLDEGTAIIRKGKQKRLVLKEKMTYDNLVKNRQEWLNLQSVEYFLKWIK